MTEPQPDAPEAIEQPKAADQLDKIQPVGDDPITPEWCDNLSQQLLASTWLGASACQRALPAAQLLRIFKEASDLLKAEPTLLEVMIACRAAVAVWFAVWIGQAAERMPRALQLEPALLVPTHSTQHALLPHARPKSPHQIKPSELGSCPVSVVGDTHGQFHDVLRL